MPAGDPGLRRTDYRRPGGPRLAEMLSATARLLQAEPDLDTTLQAVVAVTLSNVPGAEHAGITTLDKGRHPVTPAASHARPIAEVATGMREPTSRLSVSAAELRQFST